MSVQNRPNLHGIGLMVDICDDIDMRRRGKAGVAPFREIIALISGPTAQFIELIDGLLDDRYGVEPLTEVESAIQDAKEVGEIVKTPWFENTLNNTVAPITRAWTDIQIQSISIDGKNDLHENDATFTVVVKAKRRQAA